MIAFANYASKEARENGRKAMFPGDLDNWKREQDSLKRKEFWFQLKNESSGAFIEITGDKAKEALKDFQDCLEHRITFEWSGMQIQTNDSDWKYRTSKTAGTNDDPWIIMGIETEPLFETDVLNSKMVSMLSELSELYMDQPATTHGGKRDQKVKEICDTITELKEFGSLLTRNLVQERKQAIIEALKMSLNCPTSETACAAVESARWWWEEKMLPTLLTQELK